MLVSGDLAAWAWHWLAGGNVAGGVGERGVEDACPALGRAELQTRPTAANPSELGLPEAHKDLAVGCICITLD